MASLHSLALRTGRTFTPLLTSRKGNPIVLEVSALDSRLTLPFLLRQNQREGSRQTMRRRGWAKFASRVFVRSNGMRRRPLRGTRESVLRRDGKMCLVEGTVEVGGLPQL